MHSEIDMRGRKWESGRDGRTNRQREGGSLLFNVLLGRKLSETRRVEASQGLTEPNHHSSSSLQDTDKLNELRSNSSHFSLYFSSFLMCGATYSQALDQWAATARDPRNTALNQHKGQPFILLRPYCVEWSLYQDSKLSQLQVHIHTHTFTKPSSTSIPNNSCKRQISKQYTVLT